MRLGAALVSVGAAVALALGGLGLSQQADAGEDSRSPRTNAPGPKVAALRAELARLERRLELIELSAEGAEDWMTCIRYVPVSEQGDRDRQTGYLYDEGDGTGVGFMDAIAVDRRRAGREDYLFMHFRGGCRSGTPQPGGTAEPAAARARPRRSHGLGGRLAVLERRAARLAQRSRRLERISERFDQWEGCVVGIPVTEMGDPERKFGYLFGPTGAWPGYRAAVHVDRSDWDDPDYLLLALVRGDRPGRRCRDEPGEGVD